MINLDFPPEYLGNQPLNSKSDEHRKPSHEGLTHIGVKIGRFFKALHAIYGCFELTADEIKAFGNYLSRQEAVGPILNPTFYSREGGFSQLEQVKKRLNLLKQIKAYYDRKED